MKISVIMPVYIGESWHIPITKCAIELMRNGTNIPFELVIAEVDGQEFKAQCDTHIATHGLGKIQNDINQAIEISGGDYVVITGNDIFVKPNWLESLIMPFNRYQDCGVSSLSAREGSGVTIGPPYPVNLIIETVYAPLMMFERAWRFDTAYPGMYGDSDLVMRIIASGKRAYMNCASPIFHFHGMAAATILNPESTAHQRDVGLKLFKERWEYSPYLLAKLIMNGAIGGINWAKEYQV